MSAGPDNHRAQFGDDGALLYSGVRRSPTRADVGLGIVTRTLGRRDERLIHVVIAAAERQVGIAAS
jgi:hypothetical protein